MEKTTSKKAVIGWSAVLLLVLGGVWWMGHRAGVTSATATSAEQSQHTPPPLAKHVDSPQPLQTPDAPAEQQPVSADAPAPVPVFPPEMPVLPEGTWELTPEFAAAAQLTDKEKTEIETLMRGSIEKLNALELENLEIEYEGDKSAFFVIRAFPEQAHQLKQELKAGVDSILATKKAAATRLWDGMRSKGTIERADFGMRTTRVKVTLPQHGDAGYVFEEVHMTSPHPVAQQHEKLPSGMEVFASEISVQEIPLRFRHLLEAKGK